MKKIFLAFFIAITAPACSYGQSKIAYVNSQELLDVMPSRQKAMAEIKMLEDKGIAELTAMSDNLQKEYLSYMARKESQASATNSYDEGHLKKMQQDIESLQAELEKTLQTLSTELNVKILQTVKEATAIVANRKGLEYVMDESTLMFAN